jgi:hypothetical protein
MDISQAAGIDPAYNFYNNIAQQSARQKQDEQRIAEARERIKQARLESTQKQEAADLGVNPELKDYLTVDEAVALLKANGLKQEVIDAFVSSLGDKEVVSRQALQAVILKKGGAGGSLALVGAGEGKPVQDPIDGKFYQTWKKRLPDLGMVWTDRMNENNVPVFLQEDPEGYATGHKLESIEGQRLAVSKMTGEARKTLAEQKVAQNKIQNWLTLEKRVNPNSAAGQNALGLSGKANQRADRAFGLLAIPETTWEDMHAIVTAGILTGGVPQMPTIEDQNIGKSIAERWSKLASFVTGHRTEGTVPLKYRQQLFDRIKEIKNVDNEIIDKQLGMVEVAAEDVIKQDQQRWERLKNAVIATTESMEQDAAKAAIYGGEAQGIPSAAPAPSPAEPSSAAVPTAGARKSPSGHQYTVEGQ